ncbi:DNA polymerase III subunit beta [Anoxybacillus gonensis]|uniref:Nucleotidyltransferase domain-containing protein n=1 Tax=Anoxybacillus gonensis TaxID=198467 RepID=A0AAW7TED3_9BACL|nr:nucleotidyltransferase domain-containing protein [Anoxybacillus gonensis]AKS38597.1 DNA polymerase III subunit beta [Anoxybacillus gonensis]KGP60283.1 DNA polymerase III subunit beta [Anoxybacillus gonensis]MCX8047133.1 nucleotidyltransferase domain-containing protein [Anoxybacillus gonensis]MDO0876474.1 nucleotidyltransferase domain-containing protein [Anoxybacillus gonensis]
MTTYGISRNVFERLLAYFRSEEEIQRVVLFGSRAKGTARYNSDIDLCIDYTGKQKWKVIDAIDEIVGIYSFDVLFFDSLNKEIARQIDRDGIVIYER